MTTATWKKKTPQRSGAKTKTARFLSWRNGLIIRPHHYVGLTKRHREPGVVYAVWCSQNVGSLIFRSQTSCLCASLYAWIHSARPHCCCNIHKQAFVWLIRSSHTSQADTCSLPLFQGTIVSSLHLRQKWSTWLFSNTIKEGFVCTVGFVPCISVLLMSPHLPMIIILFEKTTKTEVTVKMAAENTAGTNKWGHCNKSTFMQEHQLQGIIL